MKKLWTIMFLAVYSLSGNAGHPRAHDGFVFATTIDFTTYVYECPEAIESDYLPLETYGQYLKQLADAGVKKLYLRVNMRGLTLYPSSVTLQYGEQDRWHWQSPARSRRLINTLERYDPCVETIRIGHKYGMEVWAWESLWEDGGYPYFAPRHPQYYEYLEVARENDFDAATNPLFLRHPEYWAMRDPKLVAKETERIEAINREARLLPVRKIVMTADHITDAPPLRIEAGDIDIFISDDNVNYEPYQGEFSFEGSRTDDDFNRMVIDGLNIEAAYVKLVLNRSFPRTGFTMGSDRTRRRGQHRVYNSAGQLVHTVWQIDVRPPFCPLPFAQGSGRGDSIWDVRRRGMGFCVGEPEPNRYHRVAELTIPEVREHKRERFAELAEYPFDGFMFNLRTHSRVDRPEEYGYNPEVRSLYLDRYGVDIWKEEADLHRLHALRMESFAKLMRECKQAASGRPLYLSGLPPHDWKPAPAEEPVSLTRFHMFTHLPLPYRQMLRDGSIDGIVMAGYDFSDYFTPGITGGQAVAFGIFREAALLTRARRLGAPPDYDLRQDLTRMATHPEISEVELYESWILRRPGVLKIISDLSGKTLPESEPKD